MRNKTSDNNETKTIYIAKDIDISFSAHNILGKFAMDINELQENQLIVDFSNVNFISANQFAVFGCIMEAFTDNNKTKMLRVIGINDKIKRIIQKNGFGRHIGLERKIDQFNTVIPYQVFREYEIVEYEKYLTLSLFGRDDLPTMSDAVRSIIQDYLLELFKNVHDHTTSKKVHTCGQYFPKSAMLFFTIADLGETVQYNVSSYIGKYNIKILGSCLDWALQEGNSTREGDSPGGLGWSLIKSFIAHNKGEFHIISGTECFELGSHGTRYMNMEYPFPGTIVTIGFNLNDKDMYFLNTEMESDIIF